MRSRLWRPVELVRTSATSRCLCWPRPTTPPASLPRPDFGEDEGSGAAMAAVARSETGIAPPTVSYAWSRPASAGRGSSPANASQASTRRRVSGQGGRLSNRPNSSAWITPADVCNCAASPGTLRPSAPRTPASNCATTTKEAPASAEHPATFFARLELSDARRASFAPKLDREISLENSSDRRWRMFQIWSDTQLTANFGMKTATLHFRLRRPRCQRQRSVLHADSPRAVAKIKHNRPFSRNSCGSMVDAGLFSKPDEAMSNILFATVD